MAVHVRASLPAPLGLRVAIVHCAAALPAPGEMGVFGHGAMSQVHIRIRAGPEPCRRRRRHPAAAGAGVV